MNSEPCLPLKKMVFERKTYQSIHLRMEDQPEDCANVLEFFFDFIVSLFEGNNDERFLEEDVFLVMTPPVIREIVVSSLTVILE